MQWCQMELNEISETHLPGILKDYNASGQILSNLTKQLETLKKGSYNQQAEHKYAGLEKQIKTEKEKLLKLSNTFSIASFGIEHVFRELSQIYESHESKNKETAVSNLPAFIAELFISGFPLELMDGDSSQVPTIWINRVFQEVKKKLGSHIRVYVLSILGIQSSGKSTLLNTMFGSKFAVASGRCTKGVYLQLLPVSNDWKQTLQCDYFIIMDSEGLRSPELTDSFRHDNEIATLVTCLANTTIINFWGQTFSKDMSDIMQIAAHAYIRMKEVNIKSSFHLIFAGVPDVTAEEKNKLGVSKILDELNTMVLRIAKEEGRMDIVSGLSSIFPLIQEQFKCRVPEFLPSLWQGSMSPPESRYGEIVQSLKHVLCQGLQKNENQIIQSQPLNEFINRLKDVWDAIKQENFIFGFKNSQAIEVYADVQKKYSNLVAKVRSQLFDLSYQLSEKHSKLTQELMDGPVCFANYVKEIDSSLAPKVDEWQREVIEGLRGYIEAMSDPEMASHHLSAFEMDFQKKTQLWLQGEISSMKIKILSMCKKEKGIQRKMLAKSKKSSRRIERSRKLRS